MLGERRRDDVVECPRSLGGSRNRLRGNDSWPTDREQRREYERDNEKAGEQHMPSTVRDRRWLRLSCPP
jgi:hypothetical protein